MKREKKIAQEKEKTQQQIPQAAPGEEEFLRSLNQWIGTLQGAKLGAEGLSLIHHFLSCEVQGDEEFPPEVVHAGLEEIAAVLHRCIRRETDAMERGIWDRERVLRGEPAQEDGLNPKQHEIRDRIFEALSDLSDNKERDAVLESSMSLRGRIAKT